MFKKRENYHDKFFKAILLDRDSARSFFKTHLHPSLLAIIDLSCLEPMVQELVDAGLKVFIRDVVYRSRIKGTKEYIYLCCEHQSSVDKALPVRLARYNALLMDWHFKNVENKIPLIVNLCLYHNKRKRYPHPVYIKDYYRDISLAKQCMFDQKLVINVSDFSNEEILSHGKAALLELFLKASINGDFEEVIRLIGSRDELKRAFQEDAQLRGLYMEYVFRATKIKQGVALNEEKIISLFNKSLSIPKEEGMTLARHIEERGKLLGIKRGRLEGLKEGEKRGKIEGLKEGAKKGKLEGLKEGTKKGKLEGKRETARNMLSLGLDVALIQEVT